MRASTRTEIRNLREVAHFLLPLLCCEFCVKPLLDPKLADKVFGNKTHSPLKTLKLTVHHRNGKHGDNTRNWFIRQSREKSGRVQIAICGNTSLVHRKCHGEYEMKMNHHTRKVMKVKPLRDRALAILEKFPKVTHFSTNEFFFSQRILNRLKEDKKATVTRYELRRLKKLAAKVETKKNSKSDYERWSDLIMGDKKK